MAEQLTPEEVDDLALQALITLSAHPPGTAAIRDLLPDHTIPAELASRIAIHARRLLPGLLLPGPVLGWQEPKTSLPLGNIRNAITTHTAKLRNTRAGQLPVRDRVESFPGSDQVLGSHLFSPEERLHVSGSISLYPLVLQVLHILQNKGRYTLPPSLPEEIIPAPLAAQVRELEDHHAFFAAPEDDLPLVPGAVQITIPDPSFPGGYFSISPLANIPLIQAVSRAIDKHPGANHSLVLQGTAKQRNISPLIHDNAAVFYATPPWFDARVTDCCRMRYTPLSWMATYCFASVRSREQASPPFQLAQLFSVSEPPRRIDAAFPLLRATIRDALDFQHSLGFAHDTLENPVAWAREMVNGAATFLNASLGRIEKSGGGTQRLPRIFSAQAMAACAPLIKELLHVDLLAR